MSTSFKKEIRLFDAVMLVAGTMIGSGIFLVTADIARTVSGSGYILLTWLLAGVITIAGALSYSELAAMMPKAGGQYVYLQKAFGPLLSFLYGWSLFLVIQTGTIAAVAVAFARFTGVLVPGISEENILLDLGFMTINSVQVLAILSIILLTWINSRGVKNGKLIQNFFGSTKLIALAGLILVGLLIGVNTDVAAANFADPWKAFSMQSSGEGGWIIDQVTGVGIMIAVGVAMIGSLFSSDAWNNVSFAGDEIKNPSRTLVRSLVIGTVLVTLLYILTNIVYLLILPIFDIQTASNDRVAVAAAQAIGGEPAGLVIAVLIMISTFGCNNGCILSGARVYYAMAVDGLFFNKMARLNRKSVPGKALWMQCVWACLLCLSGTYNDLLGYVMFVVILFYILTISGVFVLRKKMPDAPRPYKAFGYPLIPALYIVLAAAFCLILLLFKPENSWPGLIIVAMGVPVYFILRAIKNKSKI